MYYAPNGDYGRFLENRLHDAMKIKFDNIYTERQLIRNYGYNASSIDFLIITNDIVICIQTKWKKSRRRENKSVYNFLDSITYLKNYGLYENKIWYGIWASRRDPFLDNKKLMKTVNVECYSCFDSIDDLVSGTVKKCTAICYSN